MTGEPESAPTRPAPPTLASPERQLFHFLIALAAWVLFVYWWLLVLGRVSPEHARFTGIFIAATGIVVVVLHAVWTIHNRLIFERRGPRKGNRPVVPDFSRDRLGRHLVFRGSPEELQHEPVIHIRLEHEGKVYRADAIAERGRP